jgi:hypothetical protein
VLCVPGEARRRFVDIQGTGGGRGGVPGCGCKKWPRARWVKEEGAGSK